MNDREKLIALIRECNKFHEAAKEKWILGGKQGERPSLIASLADHLIANGVVVREKGEWTPHGFCPFCKVEAITEWDECGGAQIKTNFCPNCGADMRAEEQNRARVENDG